MTPTPPARALSRCNCFAARKAARYLSALYDSALTPMGLRSTQFSILSTLVACGPIHIKELATMICMDRTTLATNLKPLERDGLLVTRPGKDRRARRIAITRSGRRHYEAAVPLWLEVQQQFEQAYGGPQAAELRANLNAVVSLRFEPWAE